MSAVIPAAWEVAVDRGMPALVTFGGTMAASALERVGFQALGRVRHLVDRISP